MAIRSLAFVDNDADDPYIRKGEMPPRRVRDYDADDPRGMTRRTARRLGQKMARSSSLAVKMPRMERATAQRNFFGD